MQRKKMKYGDILKCYGMQLYGCNATMMKDIMFLPNEYDE